MRTGDVVRLKSGGPSMNVEAIKDGKAKGLWHNVNHMIQETWVLLSSLERVPVKE